MDGTEFQLEATADLATPELKRYDAPLVQGEAVQASMASMVLALKLRGSLTPREADLLDWLVDGQARLFLHYDECTHSARPLPCRVDEIVKTAIESGTGAVFCRTTGGIDLTNERSFYQQSAVLEPDADSPVVVGLISPIPGNESPNYRQSFLDLVDQCRLAYSDVRALESRLHQELEKESATLVINRASGRVLAANQPACAMTETTPESLADREYGSLQDTISRSLPGSSVNLRNLAHGPAFITIVTLTPSKNGSVDSKAALQGFFNRSVRNKLAAITTAASQLAAISTAVENKDQQFLIDVVLTQADEIGNCVSRLDLLHQFDSLKTEETSVADALQSAIDLFTQGGGRSTTLDVARQVPDFTVQAPRGALMFLFDAITRAHAVSCPERAHTWIDATGDPDGRILGMRWETRCQPITSGPQIDKNWQAVAERIANHLNMDLRDSIDTDAGRIISTLFIHRK
jgi:hypothetical protein